MNLKRIFAKPLKDLGASTGAAHLAGIWLPKSFDPATVDKYIHAAFREGAENYAETHQHAAGFEKFFRLAFEKMGFDRLRDPLLILDICSGPGGNTVLPLLEILPRAHVVATDLSIELLAMLKAVLERRRLTDRCSLMQLNAEELDFHERTFDLVVGCAALHHLFEPQTTLARCARLLKRPGAALFFEPFEVGNVCLRRLWERIVSDPRASEIDAPIRAFFGTLFQQIDIRKGRDKSDPRIRDFEDKWLFTRSFFDEQAALHGFSRCLVFSLHETDYIYDDVQRPFETQVRFMLKEALKREPAALPDWAWAVVREFEQSFSLDAKRDMLIEGCIILQKA